MKRLRLAALAIGTALAVCPAGLVAQQGGFGLNGGSFSDALQAGPVVSAGIADIWNGISGVHDFSMSNSNRNEMARIPGMLFGFHIVSVPEGGASILDLLLAGAVCAGAMVFSSRNKCLGNTV